MTKCNYCGKESDDSVPACPSCGNVLREPVTPAAPENHYHSAAKQKILRGGLWLGGGLVVTIGSFVAAGPGRTYWVAWGAIAYGIFQIVLGLKDTGKPQVEIEKEESLENEFQTAVLLEARGEIQQARTIYEHLARDFPDTKTGRNAKNTIESMRANRKD